MKELIVLEKAKPGTLNYSSAGVGGGSHLAAELFKAMARVDMVHVPYKGAGPALIDLLAGHVATDFGSIASSLPHTNSGKLRALGVTGAQRSPSMPNVPTIAEAGLAGFDVSNWNGLLAPAATPADVIDKLHTAVAAVLQAADVKERFLREGFVPVGNSPAEFSTYLKAETAKWEKVIKSAGIRAE